MSLPESGKGIRVKIQGKEYVYSCKTGENGFSTTIPPL